MKVKIIAVVFLAFFAVSAILVVASGSWATVVDAGSSIVLGQPNGTVSDDEFPQSAGMPEISDFTSVYSENFDSLPNVGSGLNSNNLPSGWSLYRTDNVSTFSADDGSSSESGIYSYGTTGSSDRALGSLEEGSLTSARIGLAMTNKTGRAIKAFSITYRGEQWRRGSGTGDKLIFEYCVGCADLNQGTWTAFTSLDFAAPYTSTNSQQINSARDGNATANRTAKSATVTVAVSDNQTISFRWDGTNITNNDDGLAIDDFTVRAIPEVPDTSLTANPNLISSSTSASFSFASDDAAATFECSLDGAAFAACTSPRSYTGLAQGSHTFSVRAKSSTGTDESPVSYSWTVDSVAPTVAFSGAPSGTRTTTSETIDFSATDASSGVNRIECSLNNATFTTCTSPASLSGLGQGAQSFRIRSVDNAGNISTIATASWTVDTLAPTVSGFVPLSNSTTISSRNIDLTVTDASGVGSLTLTYSITAPQSIDGGEPEVPGNYVSDFTSGPCAVRNATSGTYRCTIPGAATGSVVRYAITATDTPGNSRSFPATGFYTYLVTSNSGPTELPPGVYDNLELDSSIVIAGDITITGTLTLTGIVSAGDFTVTFSCGAVAVSGPAEFIDGNVAKEFCGGVESFTYPIGVSTPDMISGEIPFGSSGVYAPATVSIQSATAGSSLTINAVLAQMDGSAPTHRIGVYWTTVEVGDITADLTFGWDFSSEIGNPVYYSPLRRALGSTEVVSTGSVNTGSRTVSFEGITEFCSSSPGFDAPNGGIMIEAFEWTAALIGTTAGRNELSGRVVSAEGLPLRGVSVTVVGGDLVAPLTVKTNQFGTYKFSGLEAGSTYVVNVNSGRFVFVNNSRVIYLSDSLSGEDFRAEPR